MEKIKSVRVRRLNILTNIDIDAKVTLNKISILNNKYEVIWESTGSLKEIYEYDLNSEINLKKKSYFENNINNQEFIENGTIIKGFNINNRVDGDVFINDVISQKSRILNSKHEIIQDPYNDIAPIIRNFGYDPYYLNNGSLLYIDWIINDINTGGKNWSDDNGNELLISIDGQNQNLIHKSIKIINNDNIYYFNSNFEFTNDSNLSNTWLSIIDKDVINTVLSKWNNNVPNYNVSLCSPNNNYCNLIEFINPISITSSNFSVEENVINNNKLNLIISFPKEIQFKINEDIIGLTIEIENNDQFDESLIDPEFFENDFLGLEEIYQGPDPNAKDETIDPDNSKGSDFDVEFEVPPSGKISDIQKTFIKNAVKSTGPGGPGKCARFTFNHANNYCLQILGKTPVGSKNAAGGNANQESYHKNLERLGYKRYDQGTISKEKLTAELRKSSFDIGDVVAYWGVNTSLITESCVKYGHTQIYTAGNQNNSKYFWSSDEPNNFKSGFVYGRKQVNSWRFIIFKAPKPKSNIS